MKLVLKKFGAAWCGPCRELARRQTLEKFAAKHPEVRVEIHDDTEEGSAAHARLADKWHVRSIPLLIWVGGGEELLRSNDVSARGIEDQYEKALKKASR